MPEQIPSKDLTVRFLSSNAQDFIEERRHHMQSSHAIVFLSSNAQDFIEDPNPFANAILFWTFLSSNAQDFIEEALTARRA